jgi:hypothetical protein
VKCRAGIDILIENKGYNGIILKARGLSVKSSNFYWFKKLFLQTKNMHRVYGQASHSVLRCMVDEWWWRQKSSSKLVLTGTAGPGSSPRKWEKREGVSSILTDCKVEWRRVKDGPAMGSTSDDG